MARCGMTGRDRRKWVEGRGRGVGCWGARLEPKWLRTATPSAPPLLLHPAGASCGAFCGACVC
eukprot:7530710-Lingulodinium_polyedra.AAC.1